MLLLTNLKSKLKEKLEASLVIKEDTLEILSQGESDGLRVVRETHHGVTAHAIASPSTTLGDKTIGELDQLEYDEDFACLVSEGS